MRVLAVFAHPDDAELACGGTLARHADDGDWVTCLFLSYGVGARSDWNQEQQEIVRRDAAKAAMQVIGVNHWGIENTPDQRFEDDGLLWLSRKISVSAVEPDIVYTHWIGDLNHDHELTARAVLTAFRPTGNGPKQILMGEVNSSSEWTTGKAFHPNVFKDIGKTLVRKLDALKCYSEEMREYPHPRSEKAIKARAMVRGSECGLEYAEAFELVRSIE